MTLIVNPIYDSVFKYMMEDEKVATSYYLRCSRRRFQSYKCVT